MLHDFDIIYFDIYCNTPFSVIKHLQAADILVMW